MYMNTQTFNIALPEELVKKVDELAKKEYRNRSELIREALRVYIQNTERWNQLYAYGKKVSEQTGITDEEDVVKIVSDFRHDKHAS